MLDTKGDGWSQRRRRRRRLRAVGLNGTFSPFADIDRSMPTRSVSPYFPSRYRIIALSSMALLLSILPKFKQMGSTGSIRGKVQGHVKARHAWFEKEQTGMVGGVEEKEELGARKCSSGFDLP